MRTWIVAFAVMLAALGGGATAAAANVDLSVALTDAPDPQTAGQNVSYVVTVSDATATANNVKLVDPLPAGAQLVAANGTGWTCTLAAATVTCTRPTLAVGAAPPITIIVQTPITGGVMTNTVTVSTTTDTDTNAANNTATTTTQVNTSSDLSITETAAPSPVAAASQLTYTLTVSNAGPSPAAMVHVSDTLPTSVTFVSATGTGWTCGETGGVVGCDADPLALGVAPTIAIVVTAPPDPQTLTNVVTVSAMTADPQANNNSKSLDTVVVAGADLSLALTQSADSILVSGAITYTVVVTNHGPSTATNVTVTDTLPTDDLYMAATGTGWTCSNAANIVTCTAASLPVGDAPPIAITATGPGTPQKVPDMATVSATTADPLSANNSATVETTILGSADVSVAMTGTERALTSGALTFQVTVTNQGPSTAQSIRVVDTLPDGVTNAAGSGLHWGCKVLGSTITCDTTSLDANGAAPDITITFTAPATGDAVMNLVEVTSQTHDPVADNNSAMAVANLDQIGLRGGGCQVGGGGAGLVVLVGLGLARRRRRTALAIAVLAVLGLGAARPAHAQIAGAPENFPIDHMRLALDNDGLLGVEWASVPRPGDWSAATFIGYETNPLVLYNARTGETIDPLVKKRISGGVVIGVGITKWFEAGLEMPLIYNQTRDTTLPMSTLKSPRAGDLRLAPKFLILKGGDGKVGVAAIAGIGIPTGGSSGYAGDGGLTVSPEVMVSYQKGGLRAGLDTGVLFRGSKQVVDLEIDNELFTRLGAGYRLPMGLEIDAMLMTSTSLAKAYSHVATDPLELDGGVTYATEGFAVFLMGGRGIHTGYGSPELRFLAGIRISPAADNRPLDTDGDGIPDAKDKCPREPEDKDGFQDEDGCPDPDNDKDGVPDEDDKCPNDPEDKDGFQDADGCPDPDNDKDGILDAADKCPNEAEDKDGFQDEDGCPDPDNDKDGVLDADDKCPNEPGPKETHGCPDIDSDGDGIPDRLDSCPDDKGTEPNGGCAKRQGVQIRADRIEVIDRIVLRGDAVDPRSLPTLDAVAKIIGNHGQIKVRVDGKGAASAVKYLVSKGIAVDRLQANVGDGGPLAFVLVDKIEAPKPEDKKPDEPEIEMEP